MGGDYYTPTLRSALWYAFSNIQEGPRERGKERALFGTTVHNGGSRAAPAARTRDPEPSKERVGDLGRLATVWSLLCVDEKVPQGRTESGGIVLAANAGPRVPSGGVTLKRRCTYRSSVIYLIVNKLFSLSLSVSVSTH